MENKDFFYCYSTRLHMFLKDNGVRFLHSGVHGKTKRTYWIYKSCDNLDLALESYAKYKDEYKNSLETV